MPGAQDIRAGGAYVELNGKDANLGETLKKIGGQIKEWGAAANKHLGDSLLNAGERIAGIGIAMKAGLDATVAVFAEMGNAMAKASERTGISVENLSTLAYAAQQSGADLETLEGALDHMNKAMLGASEGSKEARHALGNLGLTFGQLSGLSTDERFKLIADRLSKISDFGERDAMAMKIFGRSVRELLPMMEGGANGINALQEQARKMGLQMSSTDAKAAEKFTQVFKTMGDVIKQTAFVIGSVIVVPMQKTTQLITRAVVEVNNWLRAHKGMIEVAHTAATAIIGIGVGVAAVGVAFKAVGFALSGFGSAIGVIGSAVSLIVSPLGIVTAGIGALAGYLIYASGTGSKAIQYLAGVFGTLKGSVMTAVNGIGYALNTGKWAEAAKISWNLVQTVWQTGLKTLHDAINANLGPIFDAWNGMLEKIAAVTDPWLAKVGLSWATIGDAIKRAFETGKDVALDTIAAIKTGFENLGDVLKLATVTIELAFVQMWDHIKEAAFRALNDILRAASEIPGKIKNAILNKDNIKAVAKALIPGAALLDLLPGKPGSGGPGDKPTVISGLTEESKLAQEKKRLEDKLAAEMAKNRSKTSSIFDAGLDPLPQNAATAAKGIGAGADAQLAQLKADLGKMVGAVAPGLGKVFKDAGKSLAIGAIQGFQNTWKKGGQIGKDKWQDHSDAVSMGTFSSIRTAAAFPAWIGLGGSKEDQMPKKADKTNDLLQKLLDKLGELDPGFS